MKQQLHFILTFLFYSLWGFSQSYTSTASTTDDIFYLSTPQVTTSTTAPLVNLFTNGGTGLNTYIQARSANPAGQSDLNAKFEFDIVAASGTVTVNNLQFDFKKLIGTATSITVTVGALTPQTYSYGSGGPGTTFTTHLTSFVGPITLSTTPTHVTFDVTDIDNIASTSSNTAVRLYKCTVKDKTLPLPNEAVLVSGNTWYHNYSPDTFTATLSNTGTFESQATAVATPTTTGNSSPTVAKFTKDALSTSFIRFQMPGAITAANISTAKFRIRTYVPSSNVAGTSGHKLTMILRDNTNSGTGQLLLSKTVTVFNQWVEYEFDFTATSPTLSYENVLLAFDNPDTGLLATGNLYYIDAFQGPTGSSVVWTGATSAEWEVASNWSPIGVPSSLTPITIGTATNQPTIATNLTINSLTIATGAILSVNEGKVLTNTGVINNNGDLILKSSATGTASLVSTTTVANVTQQRYLSSNQRGWRLLSNPLASKTFNTLATASGITIGTNFTGEYVSSSNTWTSTDGTAAMDTQKAYKVFITGLTGESPTYASGPSNITLVNKGTAANAVPVGIATTATKYYLVANPYTAPVSVASIIAASTGLSNTVAYYDPTNASSDSKVKAGGYDTITATGAAGSATDVVIPAMGAIFVYATTDGIINIPSSTVFTGTPAQSGTYNHKTAAAKVASINGLQLEVKSGSVFYDKVVLQFKPVGDAGSNIDFGKLSNDILNVYSIAGTQKMAVSELELAPQTIPLGITSTSLKNYTFSVAENTIPEGYEAVLIDNLLNTSTVLAPGASYNFVIDSNAASKGDARFAINLKTAGTLSVVKNELDSQINLWPNPARGQFNILNTLDQNVGISTIEISNINGQIIHSQKSNPGTTTTVQTNNWAAGVYILKATNNGVQTTKKLIIE